MNLLKSTGQTRKLLMKLVMDEINVNKETRYLHELITMSKQYEAVRKNLVTFFNTDKASVILCTPSVN